MSYTDKQLKVLRSVSRHLFFPVQRFSGPRFWHWFQKRSRLLAVYSILYPSWLLPKAWAPKEDLIPKEQLERIRKHYADDWRQCHEYAERNNPLAEKSNKARTNGDRIRRSGGGPMGRTGDAVTFIAGKRVGPFDGNVNLGYTVCDGEVLNRRGVKRIDE